MSKSPPVVIVETSERIATVTLNRPEARNALSRQLMRALWDAVTTADADPDVSVIILTGADPAFCGGVDLKEVAADTQPAHLTPPTQPTEPPGQGPSRFSNGLFRFLPLTTTPIIGAINGVAVTGGLEIALQCTFLVASERARFADTHARIGILPGGGITVFMAESLGLRRAIEMSLTGNFISADDALRLGLVNHVTSHDDLLPFTRGLALDIASNDQVAVRRLHAHYQQIANAATRDEAHRIEGDMAESWQAAVGTRLVADRRAQVTARGRAQASGC